MKAVRLTGARSLSVVDAPAPQAGPGEVVLDVVACGICGSDLSCYKHGLFAGVVLGHELSGVVSVGSGPWEAGARVVVDPKTPCGACASCSSGRPQLCQTGLTQGVGQVIDGGFAEQMVVPASLLYRVPDGLDMEVASLAEPLAVALHGLARAGSSASGSSASGVSASESSASGSCVVFGLGPIGLLTVAALAARGASPIIGVDPVAARRALASSVGATSVVAPGDPSIHDAAASLVVETSGYAVPEATTCGSPGARVLLLGIGMEGVTVYPMAWVTRETTIIGSIAHTPPDWRDALALLAAQRSIGRIITARASLDEVPSAFERLVTNPDAGKIIVAPPSRG